MRTRTLLATSTAVISLAGLTALGGGGFAGATTTIGLSIANASATDRFTNNEITIAVNPRNNNNLIIGDNDYAANDGCGVNSSFDGGKTWGTHSFIPHITGTDDNNQATDGQYDFGGDPAVSFGPRGTAYFACYGYKGTQAALLLSRSSDGGKTWPTNPAQLALVTAFNGGGKAGGSNGQFPDHDAIHVAKDGTIYLTWAQF